MSETHHISTWTLQLQGRTRRFLQRAMPRAMPRVPSPWVACRGRPRRRGGPGTAAARRTRSTRRTRCTSASSAAAASRRRRKRCVSSAKTTNGNTNDLNWKSEKRRKIARSEKKRKIISTLWCWLYPKSVSIVMPREIGCPAVVVPTYGLGFWNLCGAWCLVRRWNLWCGAWDQCLQPPSCLSPMMPRLGLPDGRWDRKGQFPFKQEG